MQAMEISKVQYHKFSSPEQLSLLVHEWARGLRRHDGRVLGKDLNSRPCGCILKTLLRTYKMLSGSRFTKYWSVLTRCHAAGGVTPDTEFHAQAYGQGFHLGLITILILKRILPLYMLRMTKNTARSFTAARNVPQLLSIPRIGARAEWLLYSRDLPRWITDLLLMYLWNHVYRFPPQTCCSSQASL